MPRPEDLTVSQYIILLQEFQRRFGDAVVVTPGFDESEYDPAAAPVMIELVDEGKGGGHCGIYQKPEGQAAEVFKACLINF